MVGALSCVEGDEVVSVPVLESRVRNAVIVQGVDGDGRRLT